MLKELLVTISDHLPLFVIYGGDGTPYLSRYKLFDTGDRGHRLFLHQFHRGDEDREVHNHPWSWAVSLILSGGYDEDRMVRGMMHLSRAGNAQYLSDVMHLETLYFKPGDLNFIDNNTYHRVTLPNGEAWSLILSGPKTSGWGFVDLTSFRYTPWRDFIKAKGLHVQEEGPARWKAPRSTVRRTVGKFLIGMADRLDNALDRLSQYPATNFEVTP